MINTYYPPRQETFPQKLRAVRIEAKCTQEEFAARLEVTAFLEKEGGQSLFRDYLHLNEQGNDIVAREVTEFLISGYFPN
jgi:hypothetical protein